MAEDLERSRLRLGHDKHVYRIRRVSAHLGAAFMVEEVSLPAALFPGLVERNISPHCPIVLAQAYAILLGKGEEQVSLGAASPVASEILKIAEASPVLRLDRVIMTRDGRPAEWRRGECVPSRAMHYAVVMN